MSAHAKLWTESYWRIERGSSWDAGGSTSEEAHRLAKPRGFRKPGKVVRVDRHRSFAHVDNTTVDTTTTVETVEHDYAKGLRP
jgi:hypothetical protein